MTTNNSKHVTANEILWLRQLSFVHVTFLSKNEVSDFTKCFIFALILIYQKAVFRMNSFKYVNIHKFHIPYYTYNHIY